MWVSVKAVPSRPVHGAVLSGALLGAALDLTVAPAEPAQVITSLAAGCGFLVWLWVPHWGKRARHDTAVLQLTLALNLVVFAVVEERQLGVVAAVGVLSLGVIAGALVFRRGIGR